MKHKNLLVLAVIALSAAAGAQGMTPKKRKLPSSRYSSLFTQNISINIMDEQDKSGSDDFSSIQRTQSLKVDGSHSDTLIGSKISTFFLGRRRLSVPNAVKPQPAFVLPEISYQPADLNKRSEEDYGRRLMLLLEEEKPGAPAIFESEPTEFELGMQRFREQMLFEELKESFEGSCPLID